MIALPHTHGCLVCGRDNARGLHLSMYADDAGVIHTKFLPTREHVGFDGIVHGGMLATILDEVMVWAASWHAKRFHLCAEMNVRFRQPVMVGKVILVRARVERAGSRLTTTMGEILDGSGKVLVESSGKYMPLDDGMNTQMVGTIEVEEETRAAAERLMSRGQSSSM